LDEYHRASETAERAGINNEILVAWRPLLPGLASLGRWDEAKDLASNHLSAARAFGARRNLARRFARWRRPPRPQRSRPVAHRVGEGVGGSSAKLETAAAMVDLGAALVERRDMEGRVLCSTGCDLGLGCKAERLVEIAGSHLRSAGARLVGWVRRRGLSHTRELRAVHMAAANVTTVRSLTNSS